MISSCNIVNTGYMKIFNKKLKVFVSVVIFQASFKLVSLLNFFFPALTHLRFSDRTLSL